MLDCKTVYCIVVEEKPNACEESEGQNVDCQKGSKLFEFDVWQFRLFKQCATAGASVIVNIDNIIAKWAFSFFHKAILAH